MAFASYHLLSHSLLLLIILNLFSFTCCRIGSHGLDDKEEVATGAASDVDGSYDRSNPQPLPVLQCIGYYSDWLDDHRSSAMPLAGDVQEICDVRPGRLRGTVAAWIKWWVHGDGRGVTDLLCCFD